MTELKEKKVNPNYKIYYLLLIKQSNILISCSKLSVNSKIPFYDNYKHLGIIITNNNYSTKPTNSCQPVSENNNTDILLVYVNFGILETVWSPSFK